MKEPLAMSNPDRRSIRHIFLSPRPNVPLMTAADLLGMSLRDLKGDIADGVIVAVSTAMGTKVTKEEMIAAAMRLWDQSVIEEALGDDAPRLIPEAIRLVELRARVPRYQRDVLRELARRDDTSVDAILTRELEDVASAHAEELASALPNLAAALAWPGVVA
jgi:hypothetical protein